VFAVSVREPDGFACSLAEKIEFCAPYFSASDGPDIDDVGRMEGEDSLDALVAYYSADGECFVDSAALSGDYSAGKNLHALFVAFFDSAVDIDCIAYLEMWYIFPEALALNRIQ